MPFRPFFIEISLSTPIIANRPFICGDSLLAGLQYRRYQGDFVRAINETNLHLAHFEGVPQMSALLPGSLATQEAIPVALIRSIMRDISGTSLANVLDKMPTRSERTPTDGPFGNIRNSYTAWDMPKIFFIGCGDIVWIKHVLDGAAFIGSQHARGYGEVAKIRIESIETDNPLIGLVGSFDGRNHVLRPIPTRLRAHLPADLNYVTDLTTWHNPYLPGLPTAEVEQCLVPLFETGTGFRLTQVETDLFRIQAA